jgi:predicted nucleic acid-binding protein
MGAVNDVWIAAVSLEAGATLLTSDKHFERLPQVCVAVVN